MAARGRRIKGQHWIFGAWNARTRRGKVAEDAGIKKTGKSNAVPVFCCPKDSTTTLECYLLFSRRFPLPL